MMKVLIVAAVLALALTAASHKVSIVNDPLSCGQPCDNNNQCMGDECTRCDSTNFTCIPGAVCGAECEVDSDCDQSDGCSICPDGYCTSTGQCNQYCKTNTDCHETLGCTECMNNTCKSGCGGQCTTDEECDFPGSTCQSCLAGICQAPACFSQCVTTADCALSGNCSAACTNNMCTSTCGAKCGSDKECAGSFTGCGYCNEDGECAPGICGSECQPGNDNACTGSDTCTRCGGNGTCVVGLPCYSACKVNSDCDQQGSCPLCSAHGACLGSSEYEALEKKLAAEAAKFAELLKKN